MCLTTNEQPLNVDHCTGKKKQVAFSPTDREKVGKSLQSKVGYVTDEE